MFLFWEREEVGEARKGPEFQKSGRSATLKRQKKLIKRDNALTKKAEASLENVVLNDIKQSCLYITLVDHNVQKQITSHF